MNAGVSSVWSYFDRSMVSQLPVAAFHFLNTVVSLMGCSQWPEMSSHDVNIVLRAKIMALLRRVCLIGFMLVMVFN